MAKILLVDDETEFVEMVAFRLAKAGHEVTTAADGQEGLEKARLIRPDLILLDIWMPKKDGYQVIHPGPLPDRQHPAPDAGEDQGGRRGRLYPEAVRPSRTDGQDQGHSGTETCLTTRSCTT